MDQDVGFGIRQLVDIAERALSVTTNDPTIAVHAIDQIHDLLRMLVTRDLTIGVFHDASGARRLSLQTRRWDDYVALALDEVRHYGGHSMQVSRRLRALLEDVIAIAPPERVAPLVRQRDLLDASVERNFPDDADRKFAIQPDLQGHGFSEPQLISDPRQGPLQPQIPDRR